MDTKKYWYSPENMDGEIDKQKNISIHSHSYNCEKEYSDKPEYIIVSLFPENGVMSQVVLPVNSEGKYSFVKESNSKIRESVYIQAYNGKWFIYSIKPVYLVDETGGFLSFFEIKDQKIISLKNVGENCTIFIEYVSKKAFVYHNYKILDKSITIGKSITSDIVYQSKCIDTIHSEMNFQNNQWEIVKKDQTAELVVNGKLVNNIILNVGDVVQILGIKLIVGVGFISINDENGRIKISENKLKKIYSTADISFFENLMSEPMGNEIFNRFPRRRLPLRENEIKIEAPPMKLNGDKIPLMLRMGGSMVMSANSMLMGQYSMMLSSVLFPVLTSKYTDKQKKEYEERRIKKYTEYLETKRKEIEEERLREEEILNYNYPELKEVLTFTDSKQRLWERRKNDDDFLNIRLGSGNVELMAKYNFPEERFELEEDPLESKMYELVRDKVFLENVPIMNSFVENYVCGILGTKELALSFVKRLIMQVIISHSYDEVKTIFLIKDEELKKLEFIKYIPHIWNDQKNFRFLATNTTEAFQISERLKKEFDDEIGKAYSTSLKEILKKRPYYFIFALDKKMFDSMEFLKEVMQAENNCGVSVITAFEDLPKECFKIFQIYSIERNVITFLKELEHKDIQFKMDDYEEDVADACMKKLANTHLKVVKETYELPKMITFLEMFGAGKIEHLNPIQRWKENNPIKSLSAPVGVRTDGSLFELDLHEKYHGPHGLIAGMTGSGKSEFIITYILSMAINYHPDEVAFLLIDYKGGGLARAFEDKDRGIHLPHLVGTITNLDGSTIQRCLISIQSENVRRQKIFNEIKSKIGESNINIYDYQALYRAGKVDEPLPHLFIISDEFAELKNQEPEFMDKLISTARIGRSLGVHLILATQKPSGVVNEQILSNTKFRVCLKVQDRYDSMDMLKRPEAAELRDTGRFYLQVGYNEYFALGQSAWSGALYEPSDEVIIRKDNEIQFLDSLGQTSYVIKNTNKKNLENKSQLTEIVKFLSKLAEREHVKTRSLWKEPLEKIIDIEKLLVEKNFLKHEIPIGIVDRPKEQQQEILTMCLGDYKNTLIVGEAASGKTHFLQTILYAISSLFLPEDINFYIIQTSGNSLSAFKELPHCGGVFGLNENNELSQFINFIKDILEERKRLAKEYDIDDFIQSIKEQRLPLIVIVIDGYAGIASLKNNMELSAEIAYVMREGLNYGIRFIITANHINDCTAKIRQETERRFALRSKDRFVYGEILGVRCTLNIYETPGRGICEINKECLEFQVATIGIENQKRNHKLKNFINERSHSLQSHKRAKSLPKVNESISYVEFMNEFNLERIPLGYDLRNGNKISIPLQQLFCISLYFGNIDGVSYILKNFADEIFREQANLWFVKKSEKSLVDNHEGIKKSIKFSEKTKIYNMSLTELERLNEDLIQKIQERTIYQENSCEKYNLTAWREPEAIKIWRKDMRANTKPLFIVFESFKDFCMTVNGELSGMFSTFFELCRGYNIYFISCFYPNDDIFLNELAYKDFSDGNANEEEKKRSNYIFKILEQFNTERFGMLFGGQFNLQRQFNLPSECKKIVNVCSSENLNKALLSYNNNIYSLLMPCGKLNKEILSEDEVLIIT